MSGILWILFISVWLGVAVAIGQKVTSKFKDSWPKSLATLLAIAFLILLPVADEIIGGFQFRSLCEIETVVRYDKERLLNKKVRPQLLEEVHVDEMLTPVISQTWNYINIENQEILLSYKTLDSKGGWLSRTLGFQSISGPFTFDGHCGPGWARVDEIFHRLQVIVTK